MIQENESFKFSVAPGTGFPKGKATAREPIARGTDGRVRLRNRLGSYSTGHDRGDWGLRILVSGVPAYGHLLPLAPLMSAALDGGHAVGLLTSAGMSDMIATELPGDVEHLAAGPMPLEFAEETARRTGADVYRPSPRTIGEMFGGTRLDQTAELASALARAWRPDLIVADAFDAVGPLLAAILGVPWHQAGLGPALPPVIVDEIASAAAGRYAARALTPVPARTYIDPCPPLLQEPGWTSAVRRLPVRPQAHRRPGGTGAAAGVGVSDLPRVLVTMGTIFSEPPLLAAIVDAVRSHQVNVVVTEGMSIHGPSEATADGGDREALPAGGSVRYIPFTPLDELLDRTDVVIGAGGSGTVLAALSRGLPMVLWPQGADQNINAARAAARGVAVTVEDSAEITHALATILKDESYRSAARRAAAEIAAMPSPGEVLRTIAG
jgi:UDP:flavonoid glycosyltransferase YjiC (YdhE family)